MKENVAIYIRTNQKDVLEKEKKNLLEYCDKNFFKKKKLYIDTNCSGRKKNPKLNELIIDIEKGEINKVLVSKIEEINRNIVILENFISRCNHMGTNILVVNKKKNQYKTLELKEEIKNIHNKMQEDVTYEIEN